jgi:UDP-3-O-[3-hydroxymyristoyl] N-acetylglucosamine deacetylase
MIQTRKQATLADAVKFEGIGAHSGVLSEVIIRPAAVDSGIVFSLRNKKHLNDLVRIKVSQENVLQTDMCTKIGKNDEDCVAVTEHLLAAFRICGITNAQIEISTNEVPILDGSATPFIKAFKKTGIELQDGYIFALQIERPITVSTSTSTIKITPQQISEITVRLEGERITPVINGNEEYTFALDDNMFEIAQARTFGWFDDLEKIRSRGLALGASEENTIAIGSDNAILNAGGLRHPKEIVMHKCLDLIGDLMVLGFDIIGKFECVNPSHALNNMLRGAILKDNMCNTTLLQESLLLQQKLTEFA